MNVKSTDYGFLIKMAAAILFIVIISFTTVLAYFGNIYFNKVEFELKMKYVLKKLEEYMVFR